MNVARKPDLPEMARDYAGRVMVTVHGFNTVSHRDPPSCSWAWSDFLYAAGCGRPSLSSGPGPVPGYQVGACGYFVGHLRGDTWGALVVLASLLLEEPPEELAALATLLLAGGWAWVVERP